MDKKIHIWGGCVSRDAFTFNNQEHLVGDYIARTLIASAFQKKIVLDQEIKLESQFQKSLVEMDLNKNHFDRFKPTETDCILLDFLIERSAIGCVGETFFTLSDEAINAGLGSICDRQIPFNSEERMAIFKTGLQKFLTRFQNHQIVVNAMFLAEQSCEGERNIDAFPQLNELNDHLFELYCECERHGVELIKSRPYCSDPDHIWGPSPMHYEKAFYTNFMSLLQKLAF